MTCLLCSSHLKGLGHEMNTFKSVLSLLQIRKRVSQFQPAFLKRKLNLKVLLASLKTLNNSKFCSGSRSRISVQLFLVNFRLCFSAIRRFSPCCRYQSRFPEHYLGSQAASCKHTQVQIFAVGPLKRVIERNIKICNFIEASKIFDFELSVNKSSKNLKIICFTFKKIFISWHCRFKGRLAYVDSKNVS